MSKKPKTKPKPDPRIVKIPLSPGIYEFRLVEGMPKKYRDSDGDPRRWHRVQVMDYEGELLFYDETSEKLERLTTWRPPVEWRKVEFQAGDRVRLVRRDPNVAIPWGAQVERRLGHVFGVVLIDNDGTIKGNFGSVFHSPDCFELVDPSTPFCQKPHSPPRNCECLGGHA